MGLRNRNLYLDEECFFVTTTCKDWLHVFINEAYFSILPCCQVFPPQVSGMQKVLPNNVLFLFVFCP